MTKEQIDEIRERHRTDAKNITEDPTDYGYKNNFSWIDELMTDREALLEEVDRLAVQIMQHTE